MTVLLKKRIFWALFVLLSGILLTLSTQIFSQQKQESLKLTLEDADLQNASWTFEALVALREAQNYTGPRAILYYTDLHEHTLIHWFDHNQKSKAFGAERNDTLCSSESESLTGSPAQKSYRLGRCQEYALKPEQAVRSYMEVFRQAKDSSEVKDANRRLLVLALHHQPLSMYLGLSLEIEKHFPDPFYQDILMECPSRPKDLQNEYVLFPEILEAALLQFQKPDFPEKPQGQEIVQAMPLKSIEDTLPPTGSLVRITFEKDRPIQGILVSEPMAQTLLVKTMLGVIRIPKNQYKSIIQAE